MTRLLTRTLLISCLLAASGCGFALRGSFNLPEAWRDIALESPSPNSELTRSVREGFESNEVRVTDRGEANYVLYLGNEKFERRNLTIGGNARAAEFELVMSTSLRVTDKSGEEIMAETELSARSIMTHDPENVTGKVEESRLLQREMRQNLTQQVLRQVRFLAAPAAS